MLNVSVVIPAYNAEKWIGRAVRSVLNQTVKPAEIIVVDDGSVDRTSAIVKSMGDRVRYIHQANSGPGAARNRGIDHAESEWIAFLDADDEWLPHKIDSQVRVLEKNPDLKWCGSAHEFYRNGIVSLSSLPDDLKQESANHRGSSYFSALLKNATFTTSGLIIHKSVFDEVGGFDPEMPTGQDEDMWCRIALKYPRIGYCCDPCWRYYNDNPNSVHRRGSGHRDLQLRSLCKNMRRARELGPDVVKEFYPYARMKVVDYLIREASQNCFIKSDTIEDAKSLFPLTVRERMLLAGMRCIPAPIASRLANRFRL